MCYITMWEINKRCRTWANDLWYAYSRLNLLELSFVWRLNNAWDVRNSSWKRTAVLLLHEGCTDLPNACNSSCCLTLRRLQQLSRRFHLNFLWITFGSENWTGSMRGTRGFHGNHYLYIWKSACLSSAEVRRNMKFYWGRKPSNSYLMLRRLGKNCATGI